MYKIFGDSGFDLVLVIILCLFTLIWIVSVIITNVSIVDILWGLAYTTQVLVYFFTHDYNLSNLAVMLVVGIHGLRLGVYIFIRNVGKEEDRRYVAFRNKFGGERHYWWISFFQVFMLQGIINLAVCSPFGLFMYKTAKDSISNEADITLVKPNKILMIIGVVITLIGTIIESSADFELAYFKSKE